MPVAVYARDPLLRVWREYGGPTMSPKQAFKELARRGEAKDKEEQLSISQLQATRERLEQAEFTPPLTMVDQKEKAPKTPSSKPQK